MKNLVKILLISMLVQSCSINSNENEIINNNTDIVNENEVINNNIDLIKLEQSKLFDNAFRLNTIRKLDDFDKEYKKIADQSLRANQSLRKGMLNCNPLDIVTNDYKMIWWPSSWELNLPTNYTAPYLLNNNPLTHVAGSVGSYLDATLTGLQNQGIPPPVAPGIIPTWIETSNFYFQYVNVPGTGSGNSPIPVDQLKTLRDDLGCIILDVYNNGGVSLSGGFEGPFNVILPGGVGQTIGKIDLKTDIAFSGTRVITVGVSFGYFEYIKENNDTPIFF